MRLVRHFGSCVYVSLEGYKRSTALPNTHLCKGENDHSVMDSLSTADW